MEKCCCCTVRTACLIFGSLYLIGSILSIGKDGKEVLAEMGKSRYQKEQEIDLLVQGTREMGIPTSREDIAFFLSTAHYQTMVGIVMSVLLVISSALLLYGVHSKKEKLLLPSLILWPVDTIVRCIFVLVYSIGLGFMHPFVIMLNIILLFAIVIDIFIWLCVYSHRKQLKYELVGQSDVGMGKM
jgi:hypothetical protein